MPAQRTLLLITASSPAIRRVRRSRVLNFQQITMPYLAAFVPHDWEMIHIDEEVSPVDVTQVVDLVGITFHTPSAFHAYDLAAQFRRRRIPVALGGPHVTLTPAYERRNIAERPSLRHSAVLFRCEHLSTPVALCGRAVVDFAA